ncbi:MAG: L,D-transpeptidase [Pseudomonadota bacterium]
MLPATTGQAHHTAKFRKSFKLDPRFEPQTVSYSREYKPGTIVVDPRNHFLYLVEGRGRARRYGVGVGKAGLAFRGRAIIQRKAEWPSWTPTANMIRREPQKYARYAGGVPGGVNNPLGARALYLYRNGRDTYYRIHGTTQPSSIGRSVSNGCIRMINDHVIDLYNRVPVGARVVVL